MNLLFGIRLLLIALLIFNNTTQGKISIISKGKTAYSIYLAPNSPESVKKAAEELKSYFIKVAGISPGILVSAEIPSTPYISLGNTPAAKIAGLDPSAIPDDGFRIVTKGNNLFILGPDTPAGEVNKSGGITHGTSNGVYTFIEDYLGVQWLMAGESGEDYAKIKSISIPELNRTEFSPFNYRVQSFRNSGPLEEEWNRHVKLAKVAAVTHSHAWAQTIPASLYAEHPDWFAEVQGKPLPPSGTYKLETTNPGLVRAYADTIIAVFRRNPNLRWYSLSPADGSYGWSDSKGSLALQEKDPFGNLSRTPLILKFYNDVATIVGKEFPDHKLGGYIYGEYLYPPASGIPKLEPNLALVVATHLSYGYQLYRPSTQENWDNIMRIWGESAKKDGFDVYYYDLPTSIMQPNGLIWPPAPGILNFIFSRLSKYGYKGAYIYGNPVWPACGPGNYILAKLLWNPNQDATCLLNNYYKVAYGEKAVPYVKQLYNVLDTAFNKYMNTHPRADYDLTINHLKEIYGPNYQRMEKAFLQAQAVKKEPRQQQRIELLGQVFSLMQWNLRKTGLLPADYRSSLTLSDEEIDQILSDQKDDGRLMMTGIFKQEKISGLEQIAPFADADSRQAINVPLYRTVKMLIYTRNSGEVSINVKAFNGRAEFVGYTLRTPEGKQVITGAIYEGKTIRFNAEAGKCYLLDIPSRGASMKLEVKGAATAYKANLLSDAFHLAASNYMDGPVPLYFYVPEGIGNFSLTLGTEGAIADIFSPKGDTVGQLDCSTSMASRLDFKEDGSNTGFWKIVFHKFRGSSISLTLDEKLPQWLIPDPRQPLKISTY